MKAMQDKGKNMEEEIEEITRTGKFVEGGHRPLQVRFKSQAAAGDLLAKSWKLSKKEDYKNVYINTEERVKVQELHAKAQEKNKNRSEIEKSLLLESDAWKA